MQPLSSTFIGNNGFGTQNDVNVAINAKFREVVQRPYLNLGMQLTDNLVLYTADETIVYNGDIVSIEIDGEEYEIGVPTDLDDLILKIEQLDICWPYTDEDQNIAIRSYHQMGDIIQNEQVVFVASEPSPLTNKSVQTDINREIALAIRNIQSSPITNQWVIGGNVLSSDGIFGSLNNFPISVIVNNNPVFEFRVNTSIHRMNKLFSMEYSDNNTSWGSGALTDWGIGENNTGIGADALSALVDGNDNTGIGKNSLHRIVDSIGNTGIGYNSGSDFELGDFCTFLGRNTGNNVTNGNALVFVGADSKSSVDNIHSSIAIGYNAEISANNQLVIGAVPDGNGWGAITQAITYYTSTKTHGEYYLEASPQGVVVAQRGSIAYVNTGSTGQAWLKVGATINSWEMIQTTAALAIPNQEVVFGNGTTIVSSTNLKFNVSNGRLTVNGELYAGLSTGVATDSVVKLNNSLSTSFFYLSTASPESVITAPRSSIALINTGSLGELWVKTSSASDTGWEKVVTQDSQNSITLLPYGTSAGNTATVRYRELIANGNNYVGFKAADALSASVTYTLPSADGTNGYALTTNGSGILSWSSVGGGGSIPAGTIGQMLYYASNGTVVTPTSNMFNDGSDITITSDTSITGIFSVTGQADITGDASVFGVMTIDTNQAVTVPILTIGNSVMSISQFVSNATPQGAITGSPGDVTYVNDSGGSPSGAMYLKVTGVATNTGWVALSTGGGGSVPSGTSGQTLYYSGTTLTATSNFYNDGTNVGIAGNLYLDEQAGDPTNVANKGILYTKDVGALTKFFYMDSAGTVGQVATLTGSEAFTNKTYNGLTLTSTTGTFTLAASKTLTVSNTLTLTATDGSTLAIGTGGTLGSNAYTSTAYAPLASPTFTGTVTIPTPFTIGAVSMTSTGTQLNYLNAATGTTGTTNTNVVFSAAPTLSGTVTLSGTINCTSNGASVFSVGTTSFAYRTTNGGSGVNFQSVFNVDNSAATAGAQAFGFRTTDGFVFTAANGTRQISRASINIVNLNNTLGSEAADFAFLTQSAGTAMSQKMRISGLGSVVIGNEAALATTATDGFLYIPTCAGAPTGVPTAFTGKVAMIFDTTNNKLYIYDGGWLGGTVPGAFV